MLPFSDVERSVNIPTNRLSGGVDVSNIEQTPSDGPASIAR
jgi:hypothetical protein